MAVWDQYSDKVEGEGNDALEEMIEAIHEEEHDYQTCVACAKELTREELEMYDKGLRDWLRANPRPTFVLLERDAMGFYCNPGGNPACASFIDRVENHTCFACRIRELEEEAKRPLVEKVARRSGCLLLIAALVSAPTVVLAVHWVTGFGTPGP